MVHSSNESSCGQTIDTASQQKSTETSSHNHGTPSSLESPIDCMQSIRQRYQQQGFSGKATNILMSAWRSSTKRQYQVYIKKWIQFCHQQQIDTISVSVRDIIEFLASEFERGMGYFSINTARAALTSLGIRLGHYTAGTHPTVVSFLKGVFNLRPPKSRYTEVWDVNLVLQYLRKLSPVKHLSLKDLTLKLTMLIALTNAARVQTIQLLTVSSLKKLNSKFVLYFDGLLKQSRPGHDFSFIELLSYPPDRRLCVYTVLKEYLQRTRPLRKCKRLLISYIKPYQAVTKSTISRWIRTVMCRSGIDIKQFTAHSVRAASSSKAEQMSIPIENILNKAGWSNSGTFAKYYKKLVKTSTGFSEAVLKC